MRELGLSELPSTKEVAQIQAIRSQIGKDLVTARNQIKTMVSVFHYFLYHSDVFFKACKFSRRWWKKEKAEYRGTDHQAHRVPGWKITAQLYLRIAFLVREHNLYMTKSLIPTILQRSVAADASFKKLDGDKWWREVDALLTKWRESAGATASSISA